MRILTVYSFDVKKDRRPQRRHKSSPTKCEIAKLTHNIFWLSDEKFTFFQQV